MSTAERPPANPANRPTPNRVVLTATALDDDGAGVGEVDGLTVHCQGLLPGETGLVSIAHRSRHRQQAWAGLVALQSEPSEARRAPRCAAFGACGGCAWQHVAASAQLTHKRARIVAAMAAYPATAMLTIPAVVPSPCEFGYRNKGKYVVGMAQGELTLGAYRPRSHELIATTGCAVVDPVIDEVAVWTQGAARASGIVAYDESTHAGELRYVVIRTNAQALHPAMVAQGDVQVALVVTKHAKPTKLAHIASALARHPAVKGVVAIHNDRRDGAIVPVGARSQILVGDGTLTVAFAGVSLAVGAVEFLQVNLPQAAAMYRSVAAWLAHDQAAAASHVIDLYAGVGGIALHLAQAGLTVTAIELEQAAMETLQRAAHAAKLPITVKAGNASQIAALASEPHAKPVAGIVVNPPRKGLDVDTLAYLATHGPAKVAYISCGPTSLARDLHALIGAGYHVAALTPYDLMPHTSQVETVVLLTRS